MRTLSRVVAATMALSAGAAHAAEVTVKNDSLTDFGSAVIVTGFTSSEKAASWLTSPCDGNIRAAQVFWRSAAGNTPPEFGQAIEIYRGGTFPNPGALAQSILGPVLTDNALNEYRFLDAESTVPLIVPVTQNETFVGALDFDAAPPELVGPSVVRDVDGCQANRNTIFAEFGATHLWVSSCALGVTGDWVIRAVVDCGAVGNNADLAVDVSATDTAVEPGDAVQITIAVTNAGPGPANNAILLDTFPSGLENVTWTCLPAGGATCPTPSSGSGAIGAMVSLPSGSSLAFTAQATVAASASGSIVNSATIVPPGGVTDPATTNNIDSVTFEVFVDPIFMHSFEN